MTPVDRTLFRLTKPYIILSWVFVFCNYGYFNEPEKLIKGSIFITS